MEVQKYERNDWLVFFLLLLLLLLLTLDCSYN